jgi:hypothetical protein
MANWYILWQTGIFYGELVYFIAIWYAYIMAIWYILGSVYSHIGMLYQEKSGNPVEQSGVR